MKAKIPLKLIFDPSRKKNKMHMGLASCSLGINNDDGSKAGEVIGALGGGVDVSFEDGKTYTLRFVDIWNAVCKATDQKELRLESQQTPQP